MHAHHAEKRTIYRYQASGVTASRQPRQRTALVGGQMHTPSALVKHDSSRTKRESVCSPLYSQPYGLRPPWHCCLVRHKRRVVRKSFKIVIGAWLQRRFAGSQRILVSFVSVPSTIIYGVFLQLSLSYLRSGVTWRAILPPSGYGVRPFVFIAGGVYGIFSPRRLASNHANTRWALYSHQRFRKKQLPARPDWNPHHRP